MATRALDSDATPTTLPLALSLALALAGQLVLANVHAPPWQGIGLYAVAAILFVSTLRRVEANFPPLLIGASPSQARPPRLVLWATAFAFSAITVQGVQTLPKTPVVGLALVVFWAVSILLYSFSVIRVSGWAARLNLRGWWRAHWRTVLIAAAFGLAAFSIRAYDLELHPYAFINDEGEVGKEALRILSGQRTNFFDVAWASQPILAFLPTALSVRLLGHTALAVRLVSVVLGSLTVSLLYLLGRELFDPVVGALAASVLLALPFHVQFSRLGVYNVADAFFSTLVLWLTFRAVRRGTPIAYLIAGLVTGAALFTYLGSRLAIALAVGSLAYVALRCSGFVRKQGAPLLMFAGAGLVMALPMAAYFIKTPDQFYARLNAEGILNNGFLQREAASGRGYLEVLLNQFSRSTLVYVARPAVASFFNSPQPYLTPLAAIFFVLGMGYTIWRMRDPRHITILAWFWAVVIFGSTLTVGPPSNQRLLMSAPPLALFVALGLQKSAGLLTHRDFVPPRIGLGLCGLVAAIIVVQGVTFYFGEYRWGHYFEDRSNEFSYEVARKAESLGPGYRMFLLGAPNVYSVFGNFGYLAPDVEVVDYNTVTAHSFAALPRDKGAFFVAVPGRVDDLRLVQQWAPGGTWQETARRFQAPQSSFFAYLVPPQVFRGP